MGKEQLAQPRPPGPDQLATAPTLSGGRLSPIPGAELKHKLEAELTNAH